MRKRESCLRATWGLGLPLLRPAGNRQHEIKEQENRRWTDVLIERLCQPIRCCWCRIHHQPNHMFDSKIQNHNSLSILFSRTLTFLTLWNSSVWASFGFTWFSSDDIFELSPATPQMHLHRPTFQCWSLLSKSFRFRVFTYLSKPYINIYTY